MDISTFIALKKNYVARSVANELIVVPLTNNVAQMNTLYTLNETGKFVWENVQPDSTIDNLAQKMTEEFDVNQATALGDIQKFLDSIQTKLTK
ncbi:MAG: PqqD family protein [Paludibacter sp.]|jgi:hypothetical protein|nr:PqqD family protein [Paludibacter sp.]